MDRRSSALVALFLFVVLTGVAIVVSGTRPAIQQGIAPTVVQGAGYVFGVAGAVLLLLPERSARTGRPGSTRTSGAVLLAAMLVLVATEVAAIGDGAGGTIGLGLVRLICLVVVAAITARLAAAVTAARRHRSP